MKKRTLSLILALVMCLALLPTAALAAPAKLPTPTDLVWGVEHYTVGGRLESQDAPGYMSWQAQGTANFSICIYNASDPATPVYEIELGFELENGSQDLSGYYSVDEFDYYVQEQGGHVASGDYFFTIQALGDGVTTANSEIATSPVWTYAATNTSTSTPPSTTVDTTSEPKTEESRLTDYISSLVVRDLPYDGAEWTTDGYIQVKAKDENGVLSLRGLLDRNGNEVVPPIYNEIGAVSEGMAWVGLLVEGEMQYGFVDVTTGKVVVPLKYGQVRDFHSGYAYVQTLPEVIGQEKGFDVMDSRSLFVDKNGQEVFTGYDAVASWWEYRGRGHTLWGAGEDGDIAGGFSEGLACVCKDGKWGVIDTNGNIVVPFKFEVLSAFHNGLARVQINGKYGYIDRQGNLAIPATFAYADDFRDGYAKVGNKNMELYGLIDTQGKLVIPIRYGQLGKVSEGMVAVSEKSGAERKWGFIDVATGQVAVPLIYDTYDIFSNGLAVVGIIDERFGEEWDVPHYRYGYVNRAGQVAIPLQYSAAENFLHGTAHVGVNTLPPFLSILQNSEYWLPKAKEIYGASPENFSIDTAGNKLSVPAIPADWSGNLGLIARNGGYSIIRNPFYQETATPNRSTVLVNGEAVAFDAYTINQNNYFKLRDLAKILSGTEKQFEVTWDGSKNAINMTARQPYTTVGGEMAQGDGTDKAASLNTSVIYLDGQPIYLTAYTINQNNYFKLRDVGQTFDFDVTWDGARNTILIDTTKGYTPD